MSYGIGDLQLKRGPLYVEWSIKDYISHTAENECLESPVFFFSDETWWWLQIYPMGELENTEYVTFYLVKAASNTLFHVTFKLGMLKTDGTVFQSVSFTHRFGQGHLFRGSNTFLRRSNFLKAKDALTNDGALRVFCILRFANETVAEAACATESSRSCETLSQNLQHLYQCGRHTDVTLTVKDKIFFAHKSILVARSPVFAAMFENAMVEKKSGFVTITDCDSDSFNYFLLFMYTGRLQNVSPSIVFNLYETANKYDVKELKEECVQLMEQNLSVETFTDAVLFAAKYEDSNLMKSTTDYFVANVQNIVPTTKWEMFMAENSSLANEFVMKLIKMKPVKKEE